ncbi:MAG TPA: hypothetical protein VK464_18245 [Symbiobacteriaceae bacterium]|nr:hypothetical protein [Symbiobacteriaceae bacterium]
MANTQQLEQVVAIKTVSGNYLTVVNNGGLGGENVAITTNAKTVGPWEKFTVQFIDPQKKTFALRTSDGHYVTAVNGGGMGGPNDASSPIHTNATAIGGWEKLTFVPQADGTYAIRTSTGFYLTAVNGGGYGESANKQPIHTDAKALGSWETFTLVNLSTPFPSETVFGIKTMTGNFVTAVNNGGLGGGNVAINTDAKTIGAWEKFAVQLIDPLKMTFALRTADGHYVTAVNGGGMGGPNDASSPIHTDATAIGAWEKLTFVPQADGTYAIRTSTGFYLTAVNGGGYGESANKKPIHTDAKALGSWETFTAVSI